MDNTIKNNAALLSELINVLNRHQNKEGAVEALEYLKSARTNYEQRAIDPMMNSLVLAFDEISRLDSETLDDLRTVIREFVQYIDSVSSRLAQIANKHEAAGGKLLSREEILEEVDARRGSSR